MHCYTGAVQANVLFKDTFIPCCQYKYLYIVLPIFISLFTCDKYCTLDVSLTAESIYLQLQLYKARETLKQNRQADEFFT